MSRRRNKNSLRNDGFAEAFLANGARQYTLNNSFFNEGQLLDHSTLQKLWRNKLAQNISSLPAEEALKNGYYIEGDEEDNKILQYLDVLGTDAKLKEAMVWARHFGRSCILMLIDDGGSVEDPVNYERAELKGLEVYDKQCILEDFSGYLLNDDPNDINFSKPEWYQITPPLTGKTLYVHHSRLLLFDGELLPTYDRIAIGGGGMSVLDGIVKAIYRCDTAQSTGLNALERLSTSLLKFEGLGNMLSTPNGTTEVQKRLNLVDWAKNILNTIAIDGKDEYQVFNIPLTGVPNLLDSFGLYVAALARIPFTKLFGRSPSGLNSTGDGDMENYYSDVRGKEQQGRLKPQLEKLIKTVQLCKYGPTGGKELEDWTIKFNPLWIPTDKEVAETEKLKSDKNKADIEAICMAVDRQLLDETEAREYLKNNFKYPIKKTSLDLIDGDEDDNE